MFPQVNGRAGLEPKGVTFSSAPAATKLNLEGADRESQEPGEHPKLPDLQDRQEGELLEGFGFSKRGSSTLS